MPKTYHPTTYNFEQWRGGKLIYAETVPNVVTDEGEDWILDVAFRNNQLSGLTSFELIVSTAASLGETDVYAARAELADAGGYAAKTVNRNTTDWSAPTGTTPSSITTPASGTHTWTATADWNSGTAVEYIAIITVGLTPNRLLTFAALGGGAGRIILDTDVFNVTMDTQAGGA